MANHKNRIARLETRQRKARPMTWREYTEIDAAGIVELMERDPKFSAAWNEFTAGIKPSGPVQQVTHES